MAPASNTFYYGCQHNRVMGKQVPPALGLHLRIPANASCSLSLFCSGLPALFTTWKCLTPAKYVFTELYTKVWESSVTNSIRTSSWAGIGVKLNLAQNFRYAILPVSYTLAVDGAMPRLISCAALTSSWQRSSRGVPQQEGPTTSEGSLSAVRHPASLSEMPAYCYGREHQQHD